MYIYVEGLGFRDKNIHIYIYTHRGGLIHGVCKATADARSCLESSPPVVAFELLVPPGMRY